MASPTDIRKGRVIMYQGGPHLVMEMLHRTQGRQAGFIQTTLRNLNTGTSTAVKFRSTESVEFCHVSTEVLEYSFSDDQGVHFMHPENFEDIVLPMDLVVDQKQYLVPNHEYDLLFVDDKPVEVRLPASIDMKITESPEGIKGDSASNVQKPAKTESGLTLQVPLFIKEGDIVRVSTETGKYLGRA
ncbi:MAG: elongation factor P [Puniceicoccales bacterium]|jgi:elongation factor P|nr:elongation factor P [Puniceicoccales bacterium]